MKVKFNWKNKMYSALSLLCFFSGLMIIINMYSGIKVYIFVVLFALGIFFGVKGAGGIPIEKDEEKEN